MHEVAHYIGFCNAFNYNDEFPCPGQDLKSGQPSVISM
jgi:hypothetical protein